MVPVVIISLDAVRYNNNEYRLSPAEIILILQYKIHLSIDEIEIIRNKGNYLEYVKDSMRDVYLASELAHKQNPHQNYNYRYSKFQFRIHRFTLQFFSHQEMALLKGSVANNAGDGPTFRR
jgi:hypothetical protein